VRVLRFCVPVAALVVVVLAAVLGGRQSPSAGAGELRPPRALEVRTVVQQTPARLGSGNPVTLAFAGDVHFESPIREELATNPRLVLRSIEPALGNADLTVVNLETAITTRGLRQVKAYTFRAPASAFAALRAGGVDAVSMANNHGMDFGLTGLRDSLAAARKAQFPVIGIGLNARQAYRPYRATIRGQRIAVLAATQVLDDHLISSWSAGSRSPGLASAKNVPRLLQAVRETRKTSDTVVVFLHWGLELASCPTTDQTTLARQLVGAGADIVVGAHAHRLLGTGRLRTALVSYGLGNFVWYSSRPETTSTGVLVVQATGRRIDGYRFVPARIVSGTPRPLTGAARRSALASWHGLRGCTNLRR
jgi:poly-gamma-glutamate capsule biosynthesis protein CapA/YwtB (metallophosphatase superfamily)